MKPYLELISEPLNVVEDEWGCWHTVDEDDDEETRTEFDGYHNCSLCDGQAPGGQYLCSTCRYNGY